MVFFSSYRFKITLFGSEVDELNSFITSGNATNAVVVVLFAKVRIWNGILNNSLIMLYCVFNYIYLTTKPTLFKLILQGQGI
jgi:hypothetical protein